MDWLYWIELAKDVFMLLGVIMAAIGSFYSTRASRKAYKEARDIHQVVNSRFDEMKKLSEAFGRSDEKRKRAEDDLREQVEADLRQRGNT